VIVKRLERGGAGDTLTVTANVPDAKSNDEAAAKAVQAAETFASEPAGWRVEGYVGWASGNSEASRHESGTDE
jgi:hypothetical protein